jgi:aminoglycoside phosphotransferase (APT) family kinase protein
VGARRGPASEVEVTVDLARRLLEGQHPDLAALDLVEVARGWDNVVFRLGGDLALRIPRRALGAEPVEREQRWLPELAGRLPLPVPTPVRVGVPGGGFPWRWSVVPWFDGDVAAGSPPTDPDRTADVLGAFVAALHEPAPADAPVNPFGRGGPVADLDPILRHRVADGEEVLDAVVPAGADRVLARWQGLGDVPEWSGPPLWCHGDLHSGNLVVADGAVRAVIDFGDMTGGDPAVDLAVAWMLFDADRRARFRVAASDGRFPVDDATWRRAEMWAIHFAVVYLVHGADDPMIGPLGRHLLAVLLD